MIQVEKHPSEFVPENNVYRKYLFFIFILNIDSEG